MPVVDDASRLKHILEAAQKVVRHAEGRRRRDLDEDEFFCLAIVRLLEIIGEAAYGISPELRNRHPGVEWRQMSNMRNRLIHGYFDVNNDLVWKTVTNELPPLIAQIKEIIDEEVARG